jgi:hypothetical protein
MDTSQQIVKQSQLQLDTLHFHSPVEMPRAGMPCLGQTTKYSVSLGPRIPFAPSEEHVSTIMDVASAEDPPMEPRPAGCDPDPRRVVTPLDVNKTRALLCKYGLLPDWDHILQGITNGFNVGIKSPPSCTLIFRESRILTARPRFYYRLHCWGSSIWSLFTGFSSQQAGAAHWSFSYVSNWPGTQTELRQVQDDSRFVLPAQRPQILFSKQFHQF